VRVAGGVHTPDDESGDAHEFTEQLASRLGALGVRVRMDTLASGLELEGGRVQAVTIATGRVPVDAAVVALGSYSPLFLAPYGISIPVYPLKGYSVTIRIPSEAGDAAPTVSLTDESHKLVISRFGDRLRCAGTAELTGYDTSINAARCEAIVRRLRQLFPGLARTGTPAFWAGLRPATPNNVPIIGRSRFPNLYLNTGHGTLGWTLAAGSACALADLVAGRRPEVDFEFLSP
jgi:D-amino-acid dehydrogenase